MKRACKDCEYAVKYDGGRRERTECRRFPPQVSGESIYHKFTEFPTVSPHEWCGEFKAVESTPTPER